jgi:hypothetical protein
MVDLEEREVGREARRELPNGIGQCKRGRPVHGGGNDCFVHREM